MRPLAATLLAAFALSGCASMSRNATCALIGAGMGTAAGVIYAVNEDDYDNVETMGVTVGGAAAGAIVGYGICAVADLVD